MCHHHFANASKKWWSPAWITTTFNREPIKLHHAGSSFATSEGEENQLDNLEPDFEPIDILHNNTIFN